MDRPLLRAAGRAASWALAAAMTGVGLTRLVRSDSRPRLIGLQGIGGWLLLPAHPLVIAAAAARKPALTAVAVILAVGDAVWLRTLYRTGTTRHAPAGTVPGRLVTANMLFDNADIAAFVADLRATGADILVLQELTPEHLVDLRTAGLLEACPFQVLDPLPGYHGSAIVSTLPIAAGGAIDVAGSPMTRADVITAAGRVRVINVHAVAPVTAEFAPLWRGQLQTLRDLFEQADMPLVMAGDFNATADHRPMQSLLSAPGCRDAFTVAGRGFGATWPQWDSPVIPLMQLDHVVVNRAVTVLSADVQTNPGSDHRRLAVELAIRPTGIATPHDAMGAARAIEPKDVTVAGHGPDADANFGSIDDSDG